MTPEDCFYREGVVLDMHELIKFMRERGYGDLSDELMCIGGDIWPSWHNGGNDSFWHIRRDWVNTERGKEIWDLICLELGLEEQMERYGLIIFWASW